MAGNKMEFYCQPPLETFGELRQKIMSIGAIEGIDDEAQVRLTVSLTGKITRITINR